MICSVSGASILREATRFRFKAAPARLLELSMWGWPVTHCGKCVTIAAARFPKLFAALATGRSGWGPEVDVTLAPIHSRITLRYCHDIAVRARPLGEILVIGLTVVARR